MIAYWPNSTTGLSGVLQEFFAAVQNAADEPSSTPARQLFVDQAESVSLRFNQLYDRMQTLQNDVNLEIETVTNQITSIAQTIADLNYQLNKVGGATTNPNDLLDKRDEALRQLSELIDIQTVESDNGQMNVYIASGQALVVGTNVGSFSVDERGQIQLSNGSQMADITDYINGDSWAGC